jgi:hypothetical protein
MVLRKIVQKMHAAPLLVINMFIEEKLTRDFKFKLLCIFHLLHHYIDIVKIFECIIEVH